LVYFLLNIFGVDENLQHENKRNEKEREGILALKYRLNNKQADKTAMRATALDNHQPC